jgi:hypothetical protein
MRKARKYRISRAKKRDLALTHDRHVDKPKYYKASCRKPNTMQPVERLWWDLNETWMTSQEWLNWLKRSRAKGSRMLRPRPMIVPRWSSTIKPIRLP